MCLKQALITYIRNITKSELPIEQSYTPLVYYPFGSPMPGRSFSSNAYRYGFNGMEADGEIKGNGNSYDFGARMYDPRLGRFLSIDPMSLDFPWVSPYHYAANNPILYIDVDGKYKWPASKRKEYTSKYPMITKYLAEHVEQDVMKSTTILNGFDKWTRDDTDPNYPNNTGNLTPEKVRETVTWGSGPEILITPEPGGVKEAKGWFETTTKQIELNEDMLMQLEQVLAGDATFEEKQGALISVFGTLLHETVHYGDFFDRLLNEGEPGAEFVREVFGINLGEDWDGAILFDYPGDMSVPENAKGAIERSNKEGRNVAPTVPEKEN